MNNLLNRQKNWKSKLLWFILLLLLIKFPQCNSEIKKVDMIRKYKSYSKYLYCDGTQK